MERLVTIRSSRYGMDIQLSAEAPFDVLCEVLTSKFRDSSRFFKDARMAVSFSGRSLSRSEEEKILGIINENTELDVVCIVEKDVKNELMYKSAVEQTLTNIQKREGQFYRGTLGRRHILESESSIIILGDVELGAKVIAKGNIVIVGALYGSVHAGAPDDRSAYIVALSMQPKKLCIGDIEAKRQIIYQESLNINGPKIAAVDGRRIYLDPLVD